MTPERHRAHVPGRLASLLQLAAAEPPAQVYDALLAVDVAALEGDPLFGP
jgi:hypothetical protein